MTTKTLLDLFDRYKIRATFFTLGYIAEKHPELIKEIVSKGHEISSHGYYHMDLRSMTKDSFEQDLVKSLEILRTIGGEKVLGFRAPFFSISENNLWVFEIMKKYLKYDSSIFPTKTPLYGISHAIRNPYMISNENPLKEELNGPLLEIPMATLRIPFLGNLPIAGGFHLRFWPTSLLKLGIAKINKSGFPAMIYIHPKDLDPHMPRVPEYAWHYYWGLDNATKKFESLLKNFRFSSVREVMF
ncbi:polysaccharide deacetylase family protein [Nitrosotalea sinensis]|nr:polysaccharide deacetylase family protein [Candidatus Nitrosotalea sinensis]